MSIRHLLMILKYKGDRGFQVAKFLFVCALGYAEAKQYIQLQKLPSLSNAYFCLQHINEASSQSGFSNASKASTLILASCGRGSWEESRGREKRR